MSSRRCVLDPKRWGEGHRYTLVQVAEPEVAALAFLR